MVIFIIVVLALLLAALAYINSASNQNTALQIASTRAYWAAQSGAEWGVYQVTANNGSCASQTNLSYANTPNAGLAGCTATVACLSAPTASVTSYRISSQGTCPAGNLGVANGALSATRSVIVGITASGGNQQACVSCVENNCYLQLLFCYYFNICQPLLACINSNCSQPCAGIIGNGSGIPTYSLSYWLESP